MKIRCESGFLTFEEVRPGQVGSFMSWAGEQLVPFRGLFTFPLLASVPEYSVQGAPFLGAVATKTFAGSPGELFRANELVFDFTAALVLPRTSIGRKASFWRGGTVFVSPGLLLPGSVVHGGLRVRDYSAFFDFESYTFRYSEVTID